MSTADLPNRPHLDQLKRQARELLRSFKAGHADAAAVFAEHHPKTLSADDATLADAQLVTARRYGFDSWPKIKAHIDEVTRERLVAAAEAGDLDALRSMLRQRPDMADATTGTGEQRLIHIAIDRNDPALLRLLMEHGADARKGIWPHRDATAPMTMARERGLEQLCAVIEQVEAERQEALSCPNTTVSPAQEQLAALIRSGRDDEAAAMLDDDPSLIRQCDRNGATPLHQAASAGNVGMVDVLCDRRADARKLDADGWTPADRAVLAVHHWGQGKLEPARQIIERLRQRGCETTPFVAAAVGDVDRLRDLFGNGPAHPTEDGNIFGNRGSVLTRAVIFGRLEAVRTLLDLGFDPDEPIPLGAASDDPTAVSWGSPLWNAAAFGELEIATLLLDRGADPNANVYASGWPLDRAYENGHRDIVDLLYERGATPTPWTVCAAYDTDVLRRMLDVWELDRETVKELVWSAACCANLPAFELALPLLRQLIDANDTDHIDWHDMLCQPMRGSGPPDTARPAWHRPEHRLVIMERLLEAGADATAKGRFGLTLLHFAAARDGAWRGKPASPDERNRFATMLLDAGAEPQSRDELLHSTALGWACRWGRLELAELLIDRGMAVNEPDAEAWATPLAWAVKMNHDDVAALLRQRGATG